ncbi:MAG: S8 family serine peptidase, partial [Planctomycetota bacterium]
MPKTAILIRYLFLGLIISVCRTATTTAAEEPLWREARRHGWKLRGTVEGKSFELIASENGRPIYYITCNADAAISTGTNLLHNPPYSLDGNDLTIGIWDAGWVLASHQEFDDRVMIMDSNSEPNTLPYTFLHLDPNHATHVAGTIGAQGVDPNAKGMAPGVNIDYYDWYSDTLEMTSRAATGDGEDGEIYLSNHSYAIIAGWELGIFRAIPGDFNGDNIVNFIDFAILTSNMGVAEPDLFVDIAPWPEGDSKVDFLDLAVLTEHWLK